MQYDLLIIGAGPAGITASIYGARAGLTCALIDGDAPGGKVLKTSEIENYPGISSISGPDLAMNLLSHALSLDVTLLYGKVIKLIKNDNIFEVTSEDGGTYFAKTVIIATGTKERELGIPNEKKLYGKGVSYCAICDGALYKEKVIAVIGGGNSALHEALHLTKFASKVILIHRRSEFRADKKIVDKVLSHPKIELILNTIPLSILGDNKVEGIEIKDLISQQTQQIPLSAVFPFIGLDPLSQLLPKECLNEQNYIRVNEAMETSIPGLFAAGDVREKTLRQIVTACNDGALAATSASAYLGE